VNTYRHTWIAGWLCLSLLLVWGCEPSDDNDSTPDVQTDAPPPPTNCTSNDECADNQFCSATSGVCEMDGVCKLVEDCFQEGNDYPIDGCMGTIDCIEGQCTMVCGTGCSSNDDCADNQYCNDSSVCAADGSCGDLADCSAEGNEYDVVACDGTLVCTNNQCNVDCFEGCSSNDDCEDNQYCNGDGVCAADGSCGALDDCWMDGNSYDADDCVGNIDCVEGQCTMICGTGCSSNDDCDATEYCNDSSVCAADGSCIGVADCSADGNEYAVIGCVGTLVCTNNQCGIDCTVGCSSNDDCAVTEYCDGSGACAADGSCMEVADCSTDGNEYELPNCEGSLICTGGLCAMDCTGLPGPCTDLGGMNFGACDMVLGWAPVGGVCTFFSGCGDQGYTFYLTQEACEKACGTTPPVQGCGPNNEICNENEYCGYTGSCQLMAQCMVDADCAHPGNLYNKPKCFGIGLCTNSMCEWDCGDSTCQNLGGVDFGPCDAELGWMVVGEACIMVSGCDPKGFQTFSTQESCEQQCDLGAPPTGGKCHQLGDGTDTCDAGWFCDSLSCTITEGQCVQVPDMCTAIGFLNCGCDGTTYSNECYRIKAGVSKDHDGPCTTSCTEDTDCTPNQWCYNPNPNNGICLDYKQEGDECGGYPPPGTPIGKCDPSLVCADIPANLPDAKGVCRPPCTSDTDCPTSQYCGSSTNESVCRDDGTCWLKADCAIAANAYAAPPCPGYSICDNQNQCGWICGNADCQDVTGIVFGTCTQFLGYAWKDGECKGISGCGDQGYTFFASKAACLSECGGGSGSNQPPNPN
jgi:hypothetical protein